MDKIAYARPNERLSIAIFWISKPEVQRLKGLGMAGKLTSVGGMLAWDARHQIDLWQAR